MNDDLKRARLVPAAPILVDITVAGRAINAVAQVSKQGFVYVFDRKTGAPVWPIEERPVPPSTAPGERTSKTQPFPTRPPAFDRQGLTDDDVIDFTSDLKAQALEVLKLALEQAGYAVVTGHVSELKKGQVDVLDFAPR